MFKNYLFFIVLMALTEKELSEKMTEASKNGFLEVKDVSVTPKEGVNTFHVTMSTLVTNKNEEEAAKAYHKKVYTAPKGKK